MNKITRILPALLLAACFCLPAGAADKKIVLVAGRPSHGPGEHEFNAGCMLLKKCLDGTPGLTVALYKGGWPNDPSAFDGADAVILFMDGGAGHPVIQGDHLKVIGDLMKKGVGLGCYHFAVEVPKDKGGPEFLQWIGGYYEDRWSTNPHWVSDIKSLPDHPVTRGVKPFAIKDEWYYNIRFQPGMAGVTPILVAKPDDETRKGASSSPRGPYPHIVAASGREEILSWAFERPDGGRGFGFTGAHFHKNFGNDNFRRLVLNSVLWLAKMEVPAGGFVSSVTSEELSANQDPKGSAANRPSAPANPARRRARSEHEYGPEAAAASMKSMTTAPGLETTLFASEPMLVNPADMDVDAEGRVWVTEGANYRRWASPPAGPLRAGGDRIVVLQDTKGTGQADKAETFYQGMDVNSALGICVLGDKVIVSCSPNVFVFTDNGPGRPPTKELLFTDIKGVQHDHGVHAFVFGPDGKLYFNCGNAGEQIRDRHGNPIIDLEGNEVIANGHPYRQGMVFRCNLDGSEFEVVAHNFRNNYEVCVDSFGTMWQSDNDDDGNRGVCINYVMEYGNFGFTDEMTGASWGTKRTNLEKDIPHRHWHQNDPGVIPNLLFTGAGSPTGMLVYEGDLLPEVFRNQMIHCDASGPAVVRSYPVQPDGAGYSARIVNILTSSESWFRPSDVCVAPDGSLYVADWNDAGVGGHNMADQKLDTMTGRVYRIAPPGNKPSVPKLELDTIQGCVAALESPNQARRYLGWTRLHDIQGGAEKALLAVWKEKNPRLRARALQLLARIKGRETKYVGLALKDANPDLRITGLRIARELRLDVIPYVRALVADPSAQVRRECAIALRHNPSPQAPKLWAKLALEHDGKDRWYLEALGIGADKQESKFLAAWLGEVKGNWNTAAGRDIIWRSRGTNAPEYLAKIITNPATTAEERPRYIRALDFISGPEKEAALLEMLGASTK
jgi:putative membrane-bound dehydrogenase-like protein